MAVFDPGNWCRCTFDTGTLKQDERLPIFSLTTKSHTISVLTSMSKYVYYWFKKCNISREPTWKRWSIAVFITLEWPHDLLSLVTEIAEIGSQFLFVLTVLGDEISGSLVSISCSSLGAGRVSELICLFKACFVWPGRLCGALWVLVTGFLSLILLRVLPSLLNEWMYSLFKCMTEVVHQPQTNCSKT